MVMKSFNSACELRDWPVVKKITKSQSLNFSLSSNFINPVPIIQETFPNNESTSKLKELQGQLGTTEQTVDHIHDIEAKTEAPSRKRKCQNMDDEEIVKLPASVETSIPVGDLTPVYRGENILDPYEDIVYSISEQVLRKLDDRIRLERHKLYHSRGSHKIVRFCDYLTKEKCNINKSKCEDVHYKKIIKRYTNELLGDCSYLDRCTNPRCRNVHYELDMN